MFKISEEIKGGGITVPQISKSNEWGFNILPERFFVMACLSRPKGGKTVVIYNLLKKLIKFHKNTELIVFASQHASDPMWGAIKEMIEEAKIPAKYYVSIWGDDTKTYNLVENEIIKRTPPSQNKRIMRILQLEENEEPRDKIIIFDDLRHELKNTYIDLLCKAYRHINAKVILSTQYKNDLPPSILSTVEYILLFPDISVHKIKEIYEDMGLSMSEQDFWELYHQITSKKYNFLLYDRPQGHFRIKLNKILDIKP